MKAVYLVGAVISAMLLTPALPVVAAVDCSQGHAVYQDSTGNFELLFQPRTAVKDNAIELVELATATRFKGTIKWNMGFAVPNVQINYPCGSGVETKECYYQAVVYTLAVNNGRPEAAPNLPADDQSAADTLLFPDLSRHWHYNVSAMTKANPGEIFRLTRCGQPS